MEMTPRIRRADHRTNDYDRILDIDYRQYETSWTKKTLKSILNDRTVNCVVAEYGETMVGFLIYQSKDKTISICRLAVHHNLCRRDIGTNLLDKIKSKLSYKHRTTIKAIVREPNLSAQLFLKSNDFKATMILDDHFSNGDDAYLMMHNYSMYPASNRITQYLST